MRFCTILLAVVAYGQNLPLGGIPIGGGGGGVSFTQIQSASCNNNGTPSSTQACTFSSAPASGNLVYVSGGTYNVTISSASDNQSNTYATCSSHTETTNKTVAGQCTATITTTCGSASCFTVTLSVSSASYIDMHIYEFHRSSGSWTADVNGTNDTGGSASTETVPASSMTTTGNPDLILASFAFQASHTSDSAGSGYTLLLSETLTGSIVIGLSDEWPTSAPNAGSQQATLTPSSTLGTGYSAVISSFK